MFGNLFKVFTFLLSRNLDKSAEEYNIQFLCTPDQPEMESDRVAFIRFSINMVLGNSVSSKDHCFVHQVQDISKMKKN